MNTGLLVIRAEISYKAIKFYWITFLLYDLPSSKYINSCKQNEVYT